MKKTLIIPLLLISLGYSQDNLYPVEDFSGSGIGYSPIFLNLDYSAIGALDNLTNLNLDQSLFRTPFIIHGGEGFAKLAGHWKLGGYAGLGLSKISSMDTTNAINKSVEATFSIMMGAATIEYAIPLFRDFEISTGIMMGMGKANLLLSQSPGSPNWDDQFTVVHGSVITVAHSTSFSGMFFNLQPYLMFKWQIMNRVGLRIGVGFNKGTVSAGRWILNGHEPISNSPESVFQGIAIRSMLYFGI
ncbi:MAG: hypothetical protein HQ528_06390 [Candidatus Marinimicrobia bacterium]|nr:hypothetical protein [Candidatus Neomarinimicrobiota bacterium]